MKLFYELGYRYFTMPWDIGPRTELVELVESGRIPTGRAIDLGSGTASNAIFLAQHGFEVTGVDFAQSAIEKGRAMAEEAGVEVDFILDDLTDLKNVSGTFDLLVDYGTLDDLKPAKRDLYMQNVLPLAHPGSQFLIFTFEWQPRWWERPIFDRVAMRHGEVEARFGGQFEIEEIARAQDYSRWPAGYAVYLMTCTKS